MVIVGRERARERRRESGDRERRRGRESGDVLVREIKSGKM